MKNILLIGLLLLSLSVFSKERCFKCERDSLRILLRKATTNDQKLELLKKIVGIHLSSNLNDFDSTKKELGELVALGESKKINGLDAYRAWKNGYDAFKKRDFVTALNEYKKAINLFDQSKMTIPAIVGHVRNVFTELHQQEEKYKFYNEKTKQYQLTGPNENLAAAYHGLANYYNLNAEYGLAISYYMRAADLIIETIPSLYRNEIRVISQVYFSWGNSTMGRFYAMKDMREVKRINDSAGISPGYFNLSVHSLEDGDAVRSLQLYDSAILWQPNLRNQPLNKLLKAFILLRLGKNAEAFQLLQAVQRNIDSLKINFMTNRGSYEIDYGFYKYYMAQHELVNAEKYLLEAYRKAVASESNKEQLKYLKELARFYNHLKQFEKANFYSSKFISVTHSLDSVSNRFKISPYEFERKELQQLDSIHALKQTRAVQAATIRQNNIMLWISLAALLIISVSLSFVYRQYRINRRTLEALKRTQQQLVLAEKMASLGELTAGIAHEIQNPLNFVNNFSEVNKELLSEMNDEIQKGNYEAASLLAKDVIENQEKINHHGKRADAIVKSMLQHSRKSTGLKELIDINEMCEEYIRLAYHGLRAKDKSFNAKFETNLDPLAGKVNIIAQDVGRVLLNLINNAFYAVSEKRNSNLKSGISFEPEVTISTKNINSDVFITVSDNGSGIKQEVIDKIFQPFFTTKPTGLGTGLGLSLSYDIVKAHGGEIKVESKENEGTKFMIRLPANLS